MVSWQQITDTVGVNPDYFSAYKNKEPGLITCVALNMRPFVQRSTLPDFVKNEEKFFYFCVACKTSNQDKMKEIFKKYNPNQSIVAGPIRYDDEVGFILWMAYKAEAKRNLEQLFETISNPKKLGEVGLPEAIKDVMREKVTECLNEGLSDRSEI